MVIVLKRKGGEEKFNPNKLKRAVEKAVREGYQKKHRLVVSKALAAGRMAAKGKSEVKSSQISERVLAVLSRMDPFIAASWRKHRKH